jgi:hypothetical protein
MNKLWSVTISMCTTAVPLREHRALQLANRPQQAAERTIVRRNTPRTVSIVTKTAKSKQGSGAINVGPQIRSFHRFDPPSTLILGRGTGGTISASVASLRVLGGSGQNQYAVQKLGGGRVPNGHDVTVRPAEERVLSDFE